MKWRGCPNLALRPARPALDNGQGATRRAPGFAGVEKGLNVEGCEVGASSIAAASFFGSLVDKAPI